MGLKDFLQSRRDDAELGRGLWRRAHDRFIRGIDRFHQVLERLADTEMIELIVPDANTLADLIPRFVPSRWRRSVLPPAMAWIFLPPLRARSRICIGRFRKLVMR